MKSPKPLLDVLPGLPLPVAEVTSVLGKMWEGESGEGHAAPSEFRASQMNVVLHFGLRTSEAEALARFDSAIRFAQRYPCRIIVLCPVESEGRKQLLEGKLFSQCYIGATLREMCCCEALMLGYRPRDAGYLENQVSVWLESDLPTYHWFNRVPSERIEAQYLPFIRNCRRVVFDSAVEGNEYSEIHWPKTEQVRDLAEARLLRIRQSLGRFLSSYSPQVLTDSLQNVTVRCLPKRRGEAAHLLAWQEAGLAGCAEISRVDFSPRFSLADLESEAGICLEIEWIYAAGWRLRWFLRDAEKSACVETDLGGRPVSYPMEVSFLEPDEALAEGFFF